MEAMQEIFGPVISAYSVADGIADEYWKSANEGRCGELSRQSYKFPCYFSPGVAEFIRLAEVNPEGCADLPGVWGDILHMSRVSPGRRSLSESTVQFSVIIWTSGKSPEHPSQLHTLRATVQPLSLDDPAPVVTFYLPSED